MQRGGVQVEFCALGGLIANIIAHRTNNCYTEYFMNLICNERLTY